VPRLARILPRINQSRKTLKSFENKNPPLPKLIHCWEKLEEVMRKSLVVLVKQERRRRSSFFIVVGSYKLECIYKAELVNLES
jgi:hypothetical protein